MKHIDMNHMKDMKQINTNDDDDDDDDDEEEEEEEEEDDHDVYANTEQ